MIKYGLRVKKTGKVLGFSTSSNEDGDFCVDVSYELDQYQDNKWLVDDPNLAAYVAKFSTKWFNAGYNTPKHRFKEDELEVVTIEIIERIEPVNIKIPDIKEMMRLKYEVKDPKHYKYLLELIEKGQLKSYTWYDFDEFFKRGV